MSDENSYGVEVIARYEQYLADYAKGHGLSRKGRIMTRIEYYLLSAIERGIERDRGSWAALGIAIVKERKDRYIKSNDYNVIKCSLEKGVEDAVASLQALNTEGLTWEEFASILLWLEQKWDSFEITPL